MSASSPIRRQPPSPVKPVTPEAKKKRVQIISPHGSPGKSPAKAHYEEIQHEVCTWLLMWIITADSLVNFTTAVLIFQ